MWMDLAIVLAAALQAYLLGSIDTGILVSKFIYHDDVRNHGSGAAGMTNMLRTFGKRAAAMTAAGDVLKGVLAVCIGRWLFTFLSGETFRLTWGCIWRPSWRWWAISNPCTSASRAARACWWQAAPSWLCSRP